MRGKVLADSPHRHLVFSIPKMFRVFFLFHRKLLGQLSRCAWKAICQYVEVSLSEKLQPAGIFSIATAIQPHGSIASSVFVFESQPLAARCLYGQRLLFSRFSLRGVKIVRK
ncbi:hypothetical protein L0152_13880 [bacterium]|nr:hypothetical protein [bacterium]